MPQASDFLRFARELRERGWSQAAIQQLEQGLLIEPDQRELNYELTHILERSNQIELAMKRLAQLEERRTLDDSFLILKVRLFRRLGRLDEALSLGVDLIKQLESIELARPLWFELANLHHQRQAYEAAFQCFQNGNRLAMQNATEKQADFQKVYIQSSLVPSRSWPHQKQDAFEARLAFLIGFPRSGTTLWETLIGGHSQVKTLSEKPILDDVIRLLGRSKTEAYPSWVPELTTLELEQGREYYLSQVPTPTKGSLLLDKLPLNLLHLPLISRLFPASPILCCQRNGWSVCWSCYTQDFALNVATCHFTDLVLCAKLYAHCSRYFKSWSAVIPNPLLTLGYEATVDQLDIEIAKVLGFLGLPEQIGLERFWEQALKRGEIQTPSYQQVIHPIYRHSLRSWEPYLAQLACVRPQLESYLGKPEP